jgi:hypothetical protein
MWTWLNWTGRLPEPAAIGSPTEQEEEPQVVTA